MVNIFTCERANGQSLSDAIIELWKNPSLCEKLAQNGYRIFTEKYCLQKNGQRLQAIFMG
jgi:glycosyltransferase involved in cell wall biosynthesis